MALKYLSNISLEGNEIQNLKLHPLGSAPTLSAAEGGIYYDSASNKLMAHDGSNWYSVNGSVESVTTGDSNVVTVGGSASNPTITVVTAAIADGGDGLATADQIHTFVTTEISNIPAGSDTTYDISVGAGGANSSTIDLNAGGSGSGTDSVTISGTANETTVTESGDTITIGLPDNVTIAGNLTVNGTTTTVNSNEVNIGDSIITLNSDETGTPSQDGGIEIERGTSSNVSLVFDESTDRWTFTNDGSTFYNIPEPSDYDTYPGGSSTDLDTSGAQVIDEIDLTDGAIQSITTRNLTLANLGYTGATDANNYVHPTHPGDDISIDTGVLSGATVISDLDFNVTTDASGHVTDANATISTRDLTAADLGAISETDLDNRSYSTDIGNGTLTTIPVTHNLGTKLVHVSVMDATTFDEVFVEFSRDSANSIELIFATAPTTNQYKVLVTATE